jgi:hypothetical protein
VQALLVERTGVPPPIYFPLLTVNATLAPCLRCLPGFGFCATTRPFFTLLEKACLTLPILQECALSARFAAARVLPVTLGTTQLLSVNFAVSERASVAVTLHADLPRHAPVQPANDEPFAAFAFRVTFVPNTNWCEQVFPQLIPFGELVTLPEPFPDR